MLNEDGKIIDDTIVMHMAEGVWWVSTLYAPISSSGRAPTRAYDVSYEDITPAIDIYAVQGPKSLKVLNAILAEPADDIKRFQVADNKIGDIAVKIHRSGFTGELGYEVYCAMEDTAAVEAAIRETAAKFDAPELTILEVYVRSLPVEKGFALRQDMYMLTPYECGLGWSVNLEKDFVGKEALLKAKEEGQVQARGSRIPRRVLRGYLPAGDRLFLRRARGLRPCRYLRLYRRQEYRLCRHPRR